MTFDNQIKQRTHRVACETVFLPLHSDTCLPLLEDRVIAVCFLILPATRHRWTAGHNHPCCAKSCFCLFIRHVRSSVRGRVIAVCLWMPPASCHRWTAGDSQGSLAARPAESAAHLSRSTCMSTSCCQVERSIHTHRDFRTIAQLRQ